MIVYLNHESKGGGLSISNYVIISCVMMCDFKIFFYVNSHIDKLFGSEI
jgi:hypothetical protein